MTAGDLVAQALKARTREASRFASPLPLRTQPMLGSLHHASFPDPT